MNLDLSSMAKFQTEMRSSLATLYFGMQEEYADKILKYVYGRWVKYNTGDILALVENIKENKWRNVCSFRNIEKNETFTDNG